MFNSETAVWYANLTKPFFTPPNSIFGPAWTILYILMATSAYLIWKKGFKNKEVKEALKLFGIQLLLNIIWTPLFFGIKDFSLAFVDIIALWYYIYLTVKSFAKINKTASYLLYPYLAWVSFATLLNFSIWILNT